MDPFRTPLNAGVSKHTFGLSDRIITIGSCFSDSIGSRLQESKINTLVNPFGTVYNPHSIHKLIRYAIFNQPVPEHTYLSHGDVHLNFDFHSALSALSHQQLRSILTNSIGSTHHFIKDASWIVITYGTAWAYERTDTMEIVTNCHKQPSGFFTRQLLTQKKILESFTLMYDDLKKINPNIHIILTVSPVRHLKETLELNSVSKSILRVACHTLQELYDDVSYFPSYEILLDDLRDYRFYKSDMIHPTNEAENYVWKNFVEHYGNADLRQFLDVWQPLQLALRHKAFHPTSQAHQQFLRETLKKLLALQPRVDVSTEIEKLKESLSG
jgi:hypothetical protein